MKRKKISFIVIFALLLSLLLPSNSFAIDMQEVSDNLIANDGEVGDWFGESVAISGGKAIVGAPYDDDNGNSSGAVYIYDLETGNQLRKITPSDGTADDKFGESVAMSGNKAVVGAPYDDDNGSSSGAVYLYDLETGNQLRKITPSDGGASNYFGYSVAISGDKVVVGAYGDDDRGTYSGSIYIYDLETGNQLQKITGSYGVSEDRFGYSLAVSGDKAVVGAPGYSFGNNAGAVYIYDLETGNELLRILPDDRASDDEFGNSVAISGDTVVVGAPGSDDNRNSSGAVYIYDIGTGNQLRKIIASDGGWHDTFGNSVAISGNKVVVGAEGDDDNGSSSGAVYIYDLADNKEIKLVASDGAMEDRFGRSVAMSEEHIVIGAPSNDSNGVNSGSVYNIELVKLDFNSQGGSSIDRQVLGKSNYAKQPDDPIRTGYTFGGWYTDSNCNNRWDFNANLVTGDTTLYAKWIVDITIDTDTLPDVTVGENYSHTLSASSVSNNLYWYADGLPQGLDIDRDTGVISGAPNETGVFAVNVFVRDDGHGMVYKTLTLTVDSQSQRGKYDIVPDNDTAYTINEIDGITTLTINNNVTGFKYFNVSINPIITNEGDETVVFVHERNDVQLGIFAINADYDTVDNAEAGFNVVANDNIKIYIVDGLSKDPNVNPTLLQ